MYKCYLTQKNRKSSLNVVITKLVAKWNEAAKCCSYSVQIGRKLLHRQRFRLAPISHIPRDIEENSFQEVSSRCGVTVLFCSLFFFCCSFLKHNLNSFSFHYYNISDSADSSKFFLFSSASLRQTFTTLCYKQTYHSNKFMTTAAKFYCRL